MSIVLAKNMKMKMKLLRPIAFFALIASLGPTLKAATFELNFRVTDFSGVFGSTPTPTDPVSASIVWEAASIHGRVQSFDSISLSLDGHTYSVAEIGYVREDFPYTGIELIGATATGLTGMAEFTDDFWLRWDRTSLTPFDFSYTSSQQNGIWSAYQSSSGSFTSFTITEVPEPEIGSLGGLVLIAQWFWYRSRQFSGRTADKHSQPTPR